MRITSKWQQDFNVRVDFLEPVRLRDIEQHKNFLQRSGVYFLTHGQPPAGPHKVDGEHVFYIGKAGRQKLWTRARLHWQTLTDAKTSTGNDRTGNSKAFKAWRARPGFDPNHVWFVGGIVEHGHPWLVACAESFLLEHFRKVHGRLPYCNTARG